MSDVPSVEDSGSLAPAHSTVASSADNALFRPVRAGNAFEETVGRLLQAVRLGIVAPGEALPAERDLAARFSVSRDTVREAIRSLSSAGFLVSRRGRYGGTFVVPELPERGVIEGVAASIPPTAAQLDDILRLREILETGAARAAAARALSAADRELLWTRLGETAAASVADYRRLDSRLHLAIGELVGAPSLVPLLADNRTRLNELLDHIPLLQPNIEHSNEQHEAIVIAILTGDSDRAASAMLEHLEGSAALLRGFPELIHVERGCTAMMHDDELPIDEELVRALLIRQFPQWCELPLSRVKSGGTVNAMFRLGDGMAVRLPLTERWGADVLHEQRWLPRLAPELPVRIPTVLGLGDADETYPSPWLVVDWIPGSPPSPGSPDGDYSLADDLARFLIALQSIDTEGATVGYRGGAVRELDDEVRFCLTQIDDLVDTRALSAVWEQSLSADDWGRAPVWAHGDLLAGNVLVDGGRLSGVIDFGAAGIGDPACDLIAAWSILSAAGRDRLTAAIEVDDATWLRGRGWALAQAVIALPYYRLTNPTMVAGSLHMLGELIAD